MNEVGPERRVLQGHNESSPVASALGVWRRTTAGVLKGRLIVRAQIVQPSLQDLGIVPHAAVPRAEAAGLLSGCPFRALPARHAALARLLWW